MQCFVFICVPIQEIVLLELYPCSVLLTASFQHSYSYCRSAPFVWTHWPGAKEELFFHMIFPKAVLFSSKKIVRCASLALQIPGQDGGVTKRSLVWRVLLWLLDCVSFVQDTGSSSEPQAQSHSSVASICGGTSRVEFIFLSQSFLSHLGA